LSNINNKNYESQYGNQVISNNRYVRIMLFLHEEKHTGFSYPANIYYNLDSSADNLRKEPNIFCKKMIYFNGCKLGLILSYF